MGRWEPNARGRLAEAALTLYAKQGFETTTAAEIARLAGLKERSFFRHFADKRRSCLRHGLAAGPPRGRRRACAILRDGDGGGAGRHC